MPASRNPFLIRTAEQSESDDQFLNLFGLAVLDLLPEDGSWNRLLPIGSSPGGGKSTLLRLFTPRVLTRIATSRNEQDFAPLVQKLTKIDAIDPDGVQLLGVLVNCKDDYNRLTYLDVDHNELSSLFRALLHARLALLTIRAALQLTGHTFPHDAKIIRFEPRAEETTRRPDARIIDGNELFERARDAEQIIIDSLNSLISRPPSLDVGPSVDDFFQLLNTHRILVDGKLLTRHILIMFDDAHLLDKWQRDLLLSELQRHDQTAFASWVAMRMRALEPDVIIAESVNPNREGFELIQLDHWDNPNTSQWLLDVGEKRASRSELEISSFAGCLSDSLETEFNRSKLEAIADSERALACELAHPFGELYADWISQREAEISEIPPVEQAARWAQLQVLMHRRIRNPQTEFTFAPLPYSQIENAGTTALDTATIFMCHRNQLPYHYSAKQVVQLASSNVDQFLFLSASLFELLLNTGTIGRSRRRQLPPSAQHRLIVEESLKYVGDIHSRVPYGRDVSNLVAGIAQLCRQETWRPTVPITPGVTGVSILNSERDALIEAAQTTDSPERRLVNALASAVAHNVLAMRPTNRQRDENRTLFYLNRLVCPTFDLPLGFGGYKPRKVADLLHWITTDTASDWITEDTASLQLAFDHRA